MGLKFFDLFAGVGGFRLGMERAGHECVGSCEWDIHARETYKKNSLPQFDVLCAGFPCQTFSIAGKRAGFDDPRGNLFFEIARIAKEKRPRYLLLENVKGLLSHDKGKPLELSSVRLMKWGMMQNGKCLTANISFHKTGNVSSLSDILEENVPDKYFLSETMTSETDKPKLKQIGNVDTKGHNSLWGRVYDPNGIAPNLNANGGGMGAKTGLYAVVNDKKGLREVERATCLDANYFKGHDYHGARTMIAWSSSGRSWGREERIKIGEANTLNTGDGCRTQSSANYVSEGMKIRKLTPVECERLQGFPDNWTIGSDTQRYKQCGNAVTVHVVEYIARELRLG
jgi:DNA (cytosine-5)-methyltransferase 1